MHAAGGDAVTDYHYPAAGAPHPHALISTTGAQAGSYTYDAAGNTLTKPTATAGTQTLTWDPEGRLETSTDATGETRYIYDADGNRLIRRDPDGKTLYLPGQEIRYDSGSATTSTTRYYSFAGSTVASRTALGLSWLSSDHQGTAAVAVDAVTQQAQVRRQTPYGQPRGSQPAWPNDKGFVGGTVDNTGLVHLGAREYDPAIGRFISVDPIMDLTDPQQWNAYAYANNNPVTFSDPTGLYFFQDTAGGGLKGYISKSSSGGKTITVTGTRSQWLGEQTGPTERPDPASLNDIALRLTNGRYYYELSPWEQDIVRRQTWAYNNPGAASKYIDSQYDLLEKLILDISGVTDAVDCSEGSAAGCAWTAVNAVPVVGKTVGVGVAGVRFVKAIKNAAEIADDIPSKAFCSNTGCGRDLIDGDVFHIISGNRTGGGHKFPGQEGKTILPLSWDTDKILDAIADVATNPASTWTWQKGRHGSLYTKNGEPSRVQIEGVYEGVRIRVIYEPATDRIVTGYPLRG